MPPLITGPMTSGSKYGIDHPPCAKPPSVSSSGPPGACTTPSRLMNSYTTTRIGRSSVSGFGTGKVRRDEATDLARQLFVFRRAEEAAVRHRLEHVQLGIDTCRPELPVHAHRVGEEEVPRSRL